MEQIRMRHPETKGEFLSPKSAVGNYVAAGWEVVEEGIDPDVPTPAEPVPTGTVRMSHRELDTEITVPAAAVSQYEASGWSAKKEVPTAELNDPPVPPENPESPVSVEAPVEPSARQGRRTEGKEKT